MERFEFVGDLGEGAYGTVWKAMDKETGRMVAMKRFKEAHLDEEVMRLAIREIRLLKASSHPNVVQLYEAFKSKSGRVYMVMELVDHSLTEEVRRHPLGFSAEALKVTMWQLLQATAFLHCNNIIHRDLKPANILVTKDGTVKLCDFGFARTSSLAEAANFTQYVVTRWYRPPEVLVGGPYGTPVDVWAIGCLFSEMATGMPLFPGRDTLDQLWLTMRTLGPLPKAQMQMLLTDVSLAGVRIPSPSELRPLTKRFPEFTPEMMEVMEACLHPDPAQRLTALEVLSLPYFDDVHSYMSGTPLQELYDEAYNAAVNNGASAAPSLWASTSMCAKDRAALHALTHGLSAGEDDDAGFDEEDEVVAAVVRAPARHASPGAEPHHHLACSPDKSQPQAHEAAEISRQLSDTSRRNQAAQQQQQQQQRSAPRQMPSRRQTMDNGMLSPAIVTAQGAFGGGLTGAAPQEPAFHRLSVGIAGNLSHATAGHSHMTKRSLDMSGAQGHQVSMGNGVSGNGGHPVMIKQRASEGFISMTGSNGRVPKEVKLQFSSMSVGPGGGSGPLVQQPAGSTPAASGPGPRAHPPQPPGRRAGGRQARGCRRHAAVPAGVVQHAPGQHQARRRAGGAGGEAAAAGVPGARAGQQVLGALGKRLRRQRHGPHLRRVHGVSQAGVLAHPAAPGTHSIQDCEDAHLGTAGARAGAPHGLEQRSASAPLPLPLNQLSGLLMARPPNTQQLPTTPIHPTAERRRYVQNVILLCLLPQHTAGLRAIACSTVGNNKCHTVDRLLALMLSEFWGLNLCALLERKRGEQRLAYRLQGEEADAFSLHGGT